MCHHRDNGRVPGLLPEKEDIQVAPYMCIADSRIYNSNLNFQRGVHWLHRLFVLCSCYHLCDAGKKNKKRESNQRNLNKGRFLHLQPVGNVRSRPLPPRHSLRRGHCSQLVLWTQVNQCQCQLLRCQLVLWLFFFNGSLDSGDYG